MTTNPILRLQADNSTDTFTILGLEGTASVTISDLNCRKLLTEQIADNEHISISSLRKGVYIAKITTPDITVERKLVKT